MYKKRRKLLYLFIIVIMLACISVGYALIANVSLTIGGSANASYNGVSPELKVKFSSNVNDITSESDCLSDSGSITNCATINASVTSNTAASFSVSNLKGYGDTATIRYKIINENDGATASLNVTTILNSNTEYYDVTSNLSSQTISAGSYSILTIKVKVKKVLYNAQSATANVTVTVNASIL